MQHPPALSTFWRNILPLQLDWLPERANWGELLVNAQQLEQRAAFEAFTTLANSRIDFVRANRLDKSIQKYIGKHGAPQHLPSIKVALLGSSTLAHLVAGIRLGALRRGLIAEVLVGDYGLYRQELADPASRIHAFRPDVVVLALDAEHLASATGADPQNVLSGLRSSWKAAHSLGAIVLQQTVMPRFLPVLGNNEDRMQQSPAVIVRKINDLLREHASAEGIYLLALDEWIQEDGGLREWFSPCLWHLSNMKSSMRPHLSTATRWDASSVRFAGDPQNALCWTWTIPCGAAS